MILYFSATGNTEYVAKTLADLLEDSTLNLRQRIKSNDYSEIRSEKPFVICTPVYVCEMPRFFADYLRKTRLTGNSSVYFVFTSGGYSGISSKLAEKIIRKKAGESAPGLVYRGYADLKMPRNYIANDHYPELEQQEIERRIATSSEALPAIAEKIRAGERMEGRHIWFFEAVITLPFNPLWCRIKHGTKDFQITDKCISCGRCEKLCPVNAIRMEEKKPVWVSGTCAHCMSCIQNCPVEAIEYGTITKGKRRYLFRKYSHVINK